MAGIADGLAARADELADLATKEMGKLRSDAEREVAGFIAPRLGKIMNWDFKIEKK